MRNFCHAIRQLRKAPVFTAVAVLTLALGIGANTAIFTLLDQALLRSLPVTHPEQLVRLQFTGIHTGNVNFYGGNDHDYFSYPMYLELRDKSVALAGLIANSEAQVGVNWNKQAELADSELVSGNYFDVLGVRPAVGRLLVPADDVPHGGAVVALSFSYWQRRFDGDPVVVGKALMVNGRPFTIVGIVPPNFRSIIGGYVPALFFPLNAKPLVIPEASNDLNDIRSAWLTVEARMKPGESRAGAEASLQPLWRALRTEQLAQTDDAEQLLRRGFLYDSKLQIVDASRGFSPLRDQIRVPLLIVMGMVGLVLLMACVNVSSLMLVRAAGRVREMAVRYSLGATRWQIARQLLTEGLLLGTLGSVVGQALAPWVTAGLARRLAGQTSADLPFSTHPDQRVLLFNFSLAFLAALLFSLAPALRFLHPDLPGSLKQQSSTASGESLRLRRLCVGLQIGLSLFLLIGAGLFVQTLRNLKNVNLGFAKDHLLSFGVDPPLAGYKTDQSRALHQRILRALEALPGTRSVAGNSDPELMGMESMTGVNIAGSSNSETIIVEGPWVTPRYLETAGIPLIAGRDFSDEDGPDKPTVVIVNERFARLHFGSAQQAVGKFLQHANLQGKSAYEIIGVAGNTRHADMRSEVHETLYRDEYQYPNPGFLEYYIRTRQSPDAAKNNVREVIRQIDPNLVVNGLRTMDEQVDQSTSNDRLIAMLAVCFGVLATLMAAIGLYGVLAYSTAQRTREIGIRMALGARRQTVVRLVMADIISLAGISMALTLPCAILASRAVRSQLYNVSPADPMAIAAGVLIVTMVVILAALMPAQRAASVEPIVALRTE